MDNGNKEHISIVFIGHVDHGKSTIIGRLLADTDSLPKGKLEQIKEFCKKNARPFEFAFLLDALKDEQEQGITIDSARVFFRTSTREYMIIDAPGHIEFLKNMITGATRADAAMIVIDAEQGIRENTKRHGYIISMIGINQVSVLINKMDLVNYDKNIYLDIVDNYSKFLADINLHPISFIPISGRHGDNITQKSDKMKWYDGPTLLDQIESFNYYEEKEKNLFRFPIQDIYRFTEFNDYRRIYAGTIVTGSIKVGDKVVFYPSNKISKVKSIERFNSPVISEVSAGESIGFTFDPEIYIKPGEIMSKADEKQPLFSTRFKANFLWIGQYPMVSDKSYKLKIGAADVKVKLIKINNILDSSDLSTIRNKRQIDKFDAAIVELETSKPIAFDVSDEMKHTARFVIIDDYKISGCGVIIEKLEPIDYSLTNHIKQREILWEKGYITSQEREYVYNHKSKFIVFTGSDAEKIQTLAKLLEKRLFGNSFKVYYLGFANITRTISLDIIYKYDKDEHIRRLGELARILTDAGLIFITTMVDIDKYELKKLKLLTQPNDFLVIQVGTCELCGSKIDMVIDENENTEKSLEKIQGLLKKHIHILEYYL